MTSARSDLAKIADDLLPIAYHVSVRELDDEYFVFAVGRARIHSLEVRRIPKGYRLATWEGPDGNDHLVQEREISTIELVTREAVEWLSKDHI